MHSSNYPFRIHSLAVIVNVYTGVVVIAVDELVAVSVVCVCVCVAGVCVRSSDCRPGDCCARRLWMRVCKPRPKVGEVCVGDARKKEMQRLELYQRCPCETGLTCSPHTDSLSHTNTHAQAHTHSQAHTRTQPRKLAHRLHTCQMTKPS